MEHSGTHSNFQEVEFEALKLELAELVGRDIKLYSEQMPGKELRTRVLAAQNQLLHIFGGGPTNLIDNLVNNQSVVMQCEYRGEELSIPARFKRIGGGKCHLYLEEKVKPLRQRRFRRVTLVRPVRLAVFPLNQNARQGIGHLRWIETDTINFSSGGAMVSLSAGLERRSCLLMSLDLQEVKFPSLILAQVCHAGQVEMGPFRTGVEFVVRETSTEILPQTRRRDLPGAVFDYSAADREKLNQDICTWSDNSECL
jgi:hypothetical protein